MQYARAVFSYTHKSPDKVTYFLDLGDGLGEAKHTHSVTAVIQAMADEGYRLLSTSESVVMEPGLVSYDIRYSLNVFFGRE